MRALQWTFVRADRAARQSPTDAMTHEQNRVVTSADDGRSLLHVGSLMRASDSAVMRAFRPLTPDAGSVAHRHDGSGKPVARFRHAKCHEDGDHGHTRTVQNGEVP